MPYKNEIIDYNLHQEEIDKWISLKGEQKYMRFVTLLKQSNVDVKWNVLKDTYRYDKRLLVNLFKYLSFFEEFLRARIWDVSHENYETLAHVYLPQIIDHLIGLKNDICYKEFSIDNLCINKNYIVELRNRVSHNKIILESTKNGCNINQMLVAFRNTLPLTYQNGFVKDINVCTINLKIPKLLTIDI